jgi:MYXO-CTERM domain-containing protein
VGAAPLSARAITVDCSDKTGTCEISNNGMDMMSCVCADGSAGGGGGGNAWAGLNEKQLLVECDETLQLFCGPPLPPDGVSCETKEGYCNVDNEPNDSFYCECADGTEGGGGGGNAWAGLDDKQLYDVCLETASEVCGDPPDPTGGQDTGDPTDTDSGTTAAGDEDSGTSGDTGDSGDGGSSSGDAGSSSGDAGSSSGDADGSSGDAGSSSGGAAESSGDASASAGDASASAGDASATAGDGTGEPPSQNDAGSGCGCTTENEGGGPLALALGVFLGVLTRRGRRR